MSSYSTVKTANWRSVELGRVVLINATKELATIVEIIDQSRVLIDGPKVQRQAISLAKTVLTPIVLPNLPRGARTGTVSKKWAAADIDAKWAATSWAKKIAAKNRRAALTDFERFQVLVLKKQRRYAVKKAVAKA
ncbi:60S ribosomal protein L14-B [Meyerozyma sp. JA9]|nr:60S ribosomal protein L14-B [Meyerozyma sp. JA9]